MRQPRLHLCLDPTNGTTADLDAWWEALLGLQCDSTLPTARRLKNLEERIELLNYAYICLYLLKLAEITI